jgi:hypothetical protein
MRPAYTHEYASGIVEYEQTANARVPRTLIVSAHIPLDKSSAGYDAQKVAQLEADVADFAKRNNVRVVFTQGEINASRS